MPMASGDAPRIRGQNARRRVPWTARDIGPNPHIGFDGAAEIDAAGPPVPDVDIPVDVDDRPLNDLVADLYDAVRRLAGSRVRHEPIDSTLQATAVVHEAYVRLAGQRKTRYRSREHFLAVAALTIRRILVDQARRRRARPIVRPPDGAIDDVGSTDSRTGVDLLDLETALVRLEELDERKARVVTMRFFGGMSMDAIAASLGVSRRTAQEDWAFARSWIRVELEDAGP
ncbi:MAG: ECF-type sigma factor [Phycisphaerales bacterium]